MKKEKMKKRISIVMALTLMLSVISPGTVLAEESETNSRIENVVEDTEVQENTLEDLEVEQIVLNEDNCSFYQTVEPGGISIEVTVDRTCDIIIPEQLGDYKVEKFGCITISGEGVRRVVLPNSVKEFPGNNRIVYGTCEKVVLPEGITEIRNNMFDWTEIKYINIPDSVRKIGDWAFNYSKIKSIELPPNCSSIGRFAFYGCSELEGIELPESIQTIGEMAFAMCRSIKSIIIPSNVTVLGNQVFESCTSLEAIHVDAGNSVYKSEEGVLMDKGGTTIMVYPSAKTDIEYIFPESVTHISDSAFRYNTNIEKVVLSNSLLEIGNYAFAGCSKLDNIKLPESVDKIGWNAFIGTKYAEDYVAKTGEALIYIGKWLIGCDQRNYGSIYNAYIKEGTERAATNSLSGRKWGIVQFPKSMTKIEASIATGQKGEYASGITTVIIPDGVIEIGEQAFALNHINYINIPSSVTKIGEWAFMADHIVCEKGSYADQYAKENNMAYSYVTNTVVKGAEDGKVELEYNPDSETSIGAKVSVTGMFAEGTSIEVTELDKESDASKAFAQTVSEMEKMSIKMQMNISTDQEETSGNIHIKIPAGDEHNGKTGYILHYKNGAVETYPITITNGFAETDVADLSPFALVLESKIMKGDVDNNGEINIVDLMMCLHHVSGSTLLEGDALLAADVDNSGEVEIVDLMRLLHFVSGSSSEL